MSKKEFFINAIPMIDVEGSTNIPTVLHYGPGDEVRIGSEAFAAAKSRHELNEDFKLDLGNLDPQAPSSRHSKFLTAQGDRKSALELTGEFLRSVLNHTSAWLADNAVKASAILVAEPLVMQTEQVSTDWLTNYRKALKRILEWREFEEIDFLPEPFAVFQYYRYGIRHPIVAQQTRHHALVIDFGGGTCDICIIQTTKEGDISQAGRHSRPLAAASQPVGGYYVNQVIAKELYLRYLRTKTEEARIKTGIRFYNDWRKGTQSLQSLPGDYQNFVANFHESIYNVENPKVTLCKLITDWSVNAPLDLTVPVALPSDPFGRDGKHLNAKLSGAQFRDLFSESVWKPYLKTTINTALQRGKEELGGAPITVVLLSGGSANIGWLRELLRIDFKTQLKDAAILQLPDYQEVVAKGLAVECARRFCNKDEGDFSSVTYNRLCLVLDSDKKGCQLKPFVPRTNGLPDVSEIPGVLLPSASIISRFIEKPMRWRVRLDRPPRRQLDYYFLRSSFDPDDTANLQNVEECTVQSPDVTVDSAGLQVELVISQDSTAKPRFIYKSGRTQEDSIAVPGRAFYLDMTYGDPVVGSKAYIGLDFGTSNSSVSYVDESSVEVYRARSVDKSWKDLNDLVATLPYPLAHPLAEYLRQVDPSRLVDHALEFTEAALVMASYSSYLEYCTRKGRGESAIFKGFTQRSAGPLWALLQYSLKQLGNKAVFCSPYQQLVQSQEFYQLIDEAVTYFAQRKHHKAADRPMDTLRPVQVLANISQQVFTDNVFGFFENVGKRRFGKEFEGCFRLAHGCPPFFRAFRYVGPQAFSEDEPMLLNIGKGIALSLHPLMFWDQCQQHQTLETGHCFIFDKATSSDGPFSFKAAGFPCVRDVSTGNEYAVLAERLTELRQGDPNMDVLQVGTVENVEEE